MLRHATQLQVLVECLLNNDNANIFLILQEPYDFDSTFPVTALLFYVLENVSFPLAIVD